MSTKNKIIHIIIGTLILVPAIPLILHSRLGLDPLGCLVDSLSNATYSASKDGVILTYGVMLTVVNLIFLAFHYIRNKNIKFCIFGLLMSIALGTGIDLVNLVIDVIPNDAIYQRLLLFIFGFIIMCIGIAVIQKGKIQKMPFEGFHEALSDIVKKDINVVRVYVEVVLMVVAVLIYLLVRFVINTDFNMFDTVYFGSIVIMLLTGPSVNLIYKKILKGDLENEQID